MIPQAADHFSCWRQLYRSGYELPQETPAQSPPKQQCSARVCFCFCFCLTAVVLFCLFFVYEFKFTINESDPEISFEIHSYNDLDSFDALVARGLEWIKYDIHYVTEEDCETLSHMYNCTGGIFLLAHDDPVEKPLIQYFTSNELIAKLESVEIPLSVALCAKNGQPCGTDARYFELADNFIASLMALQRTTRPNLQFILDGAFAPTEPCLYDRWLPWVSTWTDGHAPETAFLSNNRTHSADYRFQVLNIGIRDRPNETFLPIVVQQRYGKFQTQQQQPHQYPYLVWEPADQTTIQTVSHYYSDLGAPHRPEGLRFAINMASERFHVFNAKYPSSKAWNYHVEGTQNLSRPHCFAVIDPRIVCFAWNESSNSVQVLHLEYTGGWFGELNESASAPRRLSLVGLENLQSVFRVNATHFLLCNASGSCLVYSATSRTTRDAQCPLSPSRDESSSSVLFAAMLMRRDSQEESWSVLTQSADCGLRLGATCISKTQVESASMGFVEDGTVSFVAWSANRSLFYVMMEEEDETIMSGPIQFGVGTSVSVSAVRDTIALTASDSMCWNSEYQNKEVVRFCSALPVSTPGVLNYFLGSVESWRSNKGIISSCNAKIWSSSFDQGSASAVSLSFGPDGQPRLLEVHVGVSSLNQDPICGLAVEFDGLVIDSFPIRSP